LRNRQRKT